MVADIKGSGGAGIAHTTATPEPSGRPLPAAATAAEARPTDPTEVVTLTDLASRLQRLTEAVANVPVVDQAKVHALRDALESGQYRISERDVADKLTALEALLDGASKA